MATLRIAGGHVLRPDFSVQAGDVLVDRDAGDIVDVGDIDRGDQTLDASDGLVIPGLVNGHTHASMTLLRGYADDKPLDAWLQEDIWPVEAHLTAEDVRIGTELALLEMIQTGTTAFADMYFFMPSVASVVDRAGLRARLGHGIITVGKDRDEALEDFETAMAFAEEYDGAADGRIRTMMMPHSLTTVGQSFYEEFVPRIREAGFPIHYHANETEDEVDPIVEEHGERPLTYAAELGVMGPGDFIAHGVHLDRSEIELLADAGTGVIHCPASNMKLASGMAPVQALLDAGVTVGLGTDGAASNNDLDMFDEIRDAAMLGKLAADDASAVAAASAVGLATAGSADAIGVNAGRIGAGANADLAVIDLNAGHLTPRHDLVSHLAYAARGSDVRHTVCAGDVLMRDREVTTLDAIAVRDRAEAQAADLVSRAEP